MICNPIRFTALAATTTVVAGHAAPSAGPAPNASIVHVHGAWVGGSAWDKVAADLPRSGKSLYQLSSTDADSHVGTYWRQDNPQQYAPASIRREGIVEVFGADAGPADQACLIATHRPEAIAPLGTPVELTAARFGSSPRVYVHTTQDNAVSYRLQKTMLANAGGAGRVVEIASSHVPMLSHPKALADGIADAAR